MAGSWKEGKNDADGANRQPEKELHRSRVQLEEGQNCPKNLRLRQQYLETIATTNSVFALFKRLCIYFNGQHHFEEIMWRENISRSELRTVLSTYQDIIVCCLL